MKAAWMALGTCLVLVAGYMLCFGLPIEGATPDQGQEQQPGAAQPVPAPVTQTEPATAPEPNPNRTELPDAAPAAKTDEVPSQKPVRVDPFTFRIHAVDKDGNSVPGAEIEVFQARRVPPRRFRGFDSRNKRPSGNTYSGPLQGARPVWQGWTNGTGRRTIELDLEMSFLGVSKENVGQSGYVSVWHSRKREGEWLITLEPVILLEGTVLRADNTPAAGVDVRISVTGGTVGRRSFSRRPAMRKTDAEGRFSETLEPHTIYRVSASDGKRRTHSLTVSTTRSGGAKIRKVVVRFPGAISIRGLLLDPRGKPVAGRVRLYEKMTSKEMRQSDDSPYTTSTKAGDDGSFRLDVPRHAKYRLLGSASGFTPSALTDVEVTEARAHAEVQVQLTAPMGIGGVVRDADGSPMQAAWVHVRPESGDHSGIVGLPKARDIYGNSRPATTDASGRFAFDNLHPGTRYTLRCRPNPKKREIQIVRKGIAAGVDDLVIIAREDELRSSRIILLVRSGKTDEIIHDFEVTRLHYGVDGGVRLSRASGVRRPDGRFVLSDLAMNKKYGLTVRADGLALTLVGPIVTSKPDHEIELRLLELGSLLARVRDSAGKPAVNARVWAKPMVRIPSSRGRVPMPVNSEGECLLGRMNPGPYEVYTIRDGKTSGKVKVEVRPGRQTEVTLRLPK